MRLEKGKRRFGELKKALPHVTERMLTLQLRELERDGIVSRKGYAEVPPRVADELTALGKELIPICLQLHARGAKHKLVHLGTESTVAAVKTVCFLNNAPKSCSASICRLTCS